MDYLDIMENNMLLNNNFLTEDEYYDKLKLETLDDKRFSVISESVASILGFTALAMLGGFGGALIAKSHENKKGKVRGFFRKLFGKKKDFDFKSNEERAAVKREQEKVKSAEARLPGVFKAIRMDDWDEAERIFKNSNYTDNPEMIKAVAIAISEQTGEPPLFVYPSGNDTYFKCKKILGMKYAKALTQAVIVAMKQKKNIISINDVDIDNL